MISASLCLRANPCCGLLDLQVGSHSPKWRLDVTFKPNATLFERLAAITSEPNDPPLGRGATSLSATRVAATNG